MMSRTVSYVHPLQRSPLQGLLDFPGRETMDRLGWLMIIVMLTRIIFFLPISCASSRDRHWSRRAQYRTKFVSHR